jgi:hypothetical protein
VTSGRLGADATVVLTRAGTEVAAWPLGSLHAVGLPDLALVDALARWQVLARRAGCSIHVRGASPELRALVDLAGLPVEVLG